jgi:hypothetical protein
MAADTERFRLRRFIERLVQLGECEVHDKPIDLIDVGAVLDGNPKATWFKSVGPEKAELIGNVMGSRKRLALALDTDEAGLLPAITERLAHPHKPVRVSAAEAPVQQVVLRGEEADRCALHLRRPRRDDLPRHRPHQYRLPPHHAARPAHRRHRHDRAERRAPDFP